MQPNPNMMQGGMQGGMQGMQGMGMQGAQWSKGGSGMPAAQNLGAWKTSVFFCFFSMGWFCWDDGDSWKKIHQFQASPGGGLVRGLVEGSSILKGGPDLAKLVPTNLHQMSSLRP